MKLIYPAIFYREEDGMWVEFPDLIGCQSSGDDLHETYENAKEALEAYCITMLGEKHELPKATDITAIRPPENSFTSLVETDLTTQMSKMKSVKKTLTIPTTTSLRKEDSMFKITRNGGTTETIATTIHGRTTL